MANRILRYKWILFTLLIALIPFLSKTLGCIIHGSVPPLDFILDPLDLCAFAIVFIESNTLSLISLKTNNKINTETLLEGIIIIVIETLFILIIMSIIHFKNLDYIISNLPNKPLVNTVLYLVLITCCLISLSFSYIYAMKENNKVITP